MIHIHPVPAFETNYIWVLHDSDNQALIIDPGMASGVIEYIKQHALKPIALLITHSHYDHVNGIDDLLMYCPMNVYGPASNSIPQVTHTVSDGDTFTAAGIEFSVLHTPGHLPEHISYFSQTDGILRLFCGDTLFSSGCGRIFNGSPEQLKASLDRLAALPDDTEVYAAHEYTETNVRFAQSIEPDNPHLQQRQKQVTSLRQQGKPSLPTSIAQEKLTNPFLRCDQREVMQTVAMRQGQKEVNAQQVFTTLREWKDSFK